MNLSVRGFCFSAIEKTRGDQKMEHLPKLFKTSSTYKYPVYVIKGGKLFRTVFHPDGWSGKPDYELGKDGKLYRTEHHELGVDSNPDYEFGDDNKIYRTEYHPKWNGKVPEYEIRD